MRLLFSVVVLLFILNPAIGQENPDLRKVKEDILKLHADWNQARMKKDLKALEQIFAEEYVFIHGNGFLDDRATALEDQINTDSVQPIPMPNLDDLKVYGDMAILKRLTRNPQGSNYNTVVFIRRNDRWQFALSQTTLFQRERNYIKLGTGALQSYAGKYEMNGRIALVSNEKDTLRLNILRIPRRKMLPTADNLFYDKVGTEYKFVKNDQGQVTHLILKPQFGQEGQWKKIE